ncbi:MAG: response regulator transcription factor [Planctomycetes bacterium]|nr:response regulator transcription factor [Planctomycetota bacterium]
MERDSARKQNVFQGECHLSSLTPRQLEVLRHLAEGHSVKDVAKRMLVSVKSVDNHKYRIMRKLRIRDRVELARFAIREGLTPL